MQCSLQSGWNLVFLTVDMVGDGKGHIAGTISADLLDTKPPLCSLFLAWVRLPLPTSGSRSLDVPSSNHTGCTKGTLGAGRMHPVV